MATQTEKETLINELQASYDNLEAFPDKMNFPPLMVEIHKGLVSAEPQEVRNSICKLRRIQKYERKLFILMFKAEKYLLKSLIHIEMYRKDILILLSEMLYQDKNGENLFDRMKSFIKNILKVIAENKRDEVHQIASVIIDTCINFELPFDQIETFVSLLSSKNRTLVDLCSYYIERIFFSLEFQTNLTIVNWDFIFDKLGNMAVKKVNFDIAQKVLLLFKKGFDENEWIEILSEATNEALIKLQMLDNFDVNKVIEYKEKRDEIEDDIDTSIQE